LRHIVQTYFDRIGAFQVQVNQRAKATAGLGAYSSFESSMGATEVDVKQRERLLKTQERYMQIEAAEKANQDQ
jgi:hypothetical protein